MKRWVLVSILLLGACSGKPDGIEPVQSFDIQRYLGKWFEVARLDHSFERGLSQVTAEYTLREDGYVRVINRGFDVAKGEWKEAEGTAKFVGATDEGYLKVSFFGPFYGSYVVFGLDAEYQYSFVSGPDTSYLWLLSRQPSVPPEVLDDFRKQAAAAGFVMDDLIMVDQTTP